MTEKSHVGMGHEICPVCGNKRTETVLFDRRLKDTLEKENLTGVSLCPDHQKLADEGMIALVVTTSEPVDLGNSFQLRTGDLVHIKREAWSNIFTSEPPTGYMGYIPPPVFDHLVSIFEQVEKEE